MQRSWEVFRWFLLLLMVCLAEIVDVFGDFDDFWRVLSRVGGFLQRRVMEVFDALGG